MSKSDVDDFAALGTIRLVVSATEVDPQAQREELSAFAQRLKLTGGAAQGR